MGKFVVIEGIDGVGKSTLSQRLSEELQNSITMPSLSIADIEELDSHVAAKLLPAPIKPPKRSGSFLEKPPRYLQA